MYADTVLYISGLGYTMRVDCAFVLHLVPAMPGQFSACVVAYHCVYRFVGHLYTFFREISAYLAGRPLLIFYELFYTPSQKRGQTSVAGSAFLALFGLVVRLEPYILAVLRGIALDFTTDGGFADIYKLSNYFL